MFDSSEEVGSADLSKNDNDGNGNGNESKFEAEQEQNGQAHSADS